MKKYEILQELPIYDRQEVSKYLLEKWHLWTCLMQGCHKPSVCKNYNICEVQKNKMKKKKVKNKQKTNNTKKKKKKTLLFTRATIRDISEFTVLFSKVIPI